ncbi:hypothetical protein ANO11243_061510 [Dothideomycetidae sp. 11243]|nr:hypothetical protein ANO11243_061510 [fungal sp. No.11243]
MSSSFTQSLPLEVLLNIVRQVTDLDTLANFLEASPSVSRLLGHGLSDVFERCLDAAYIDRDTKTIIYTTAYLRQGCLPVKSLDELRRRVTSDSITHRDCRGGGMMGDYYADAWYVHEADIFTPTSLPKECPSAITRSMLATFRRTTFLTMTCLDLHLQRFRALQPRRAADPEWGPKDVDLSRLRDGRPVSIPIATHDIGPPRWLEEQFMARAFWRVQFVQDIRRALRIGLLADWSPQDIVQLNTLSMIGVYDLPGLELDMRRAASCGQNPLVFQDPSELTLIQIAKDYLEQNPGAGPSPSWRRTGPEYSRPLLLPPIPNRPPPWTDQDRLSDYWSQGSVRFANTFQRFQCGYLKSLFLAPYRHLGIPIWCAERLDGYGLCSIRDMNNCSPANMRDNAQHLLTWMSVLDKEDAARLVRFVQDKKILEEYKADVARRGEVLWNTHAWRRRAIAERERRSY